MDIQHIKVGDVVKLKHGRGFMRVDSICGNEIRQQAEHSTCNGGGTVTWCDAELVAEVGIFLPRTPQMLEDIMMPHCDDCIWSGDQYACTMNCSGRTARGITKAVLI